MLCWYLFLFSREVHLLEGDHHHQEAGDHLAEDLLHHLEEEVHLDKVADCLLLAPGVSLATLEAMVDQADLADLVSDAMIFE